MIQMLFISLMMTASLFGAQQQAAQDQQEAPYVKRPPLVRYKEIRRRMADIERRLQNQNLSAAERESLNDSLFMTNFAARPLAEMLFGTQKDQPLPPFNDDQAPAATVPPAAAAQPPVEDIDEEESDDEAEEGPAEVKQDAAQAQQAAPATQQPHVQQPAPQAQPAPQEAKAAQAQAQQKEEKIAEPQGPADERFELLFAGGLYTMGLREVLRKELKATQELNVLQKVEYDLRVTEAICYSINHLAKYVLHPSREAVRRYAQPLSFGTFCKSLLWPSVLLQREAAIRQQYLDVLIRDVITPACHKACLEKRDNEQHKQLVERIRDYLINNEQIREDMFKIAEEIHQLRMYRFTKGVVMHRGKIVVALAALAAVLKIRSSGFSFHDWWLENF